jgi:hypothetical protein
MGKSRWRWAAVSNLFSIERQDWSLFTNLDTLSQKAGVPVKLLGQVALKELVDNALDAGGAAEISYDASTGYFRIADDGDGIEGGSARISTLFSVNRPLVSSKLWRLPTRGALGNGLRVVAGAIIGSGGGDIIVTTRGERHTVRPRDDGSADVVTIPVAPTIGTVIEISFGPLLPLDRSAMRWGKQAIAMAKHGSGFKGKPSLHCHDPSSFHTIVAGAGNRFVRELISSFDGCSGAKAGEICALFRNRTCESMSRAESADLLARGRSMTNPIAHKRLGHVGETYRADFFNGYSRQVGVSVVGAIAPKAENPFVVEVWARKIDSDESKVALFVNRTPIPAEITLSRAECGRLALFGCELRHQVEVPKRSRWSIEINVTTPFMPITSDGKTPDLETFVSEIVDAVSSATKRAQGRCADTTGRSTQVGFLRRHLEKIVTDASKGGRFRPSVRDLYYAARPLYLNEGQQVPSFSYFSSMIADYENENGEIDGLFREERGAIYHPHSDGHEIALGTKEVEQYERPAWLYGAIVVIEKNGLIEAVLTDGLHERLDFSPLTSRGFTTRALKDLVDKVGEHDEPTKVFCVTDADAPGTMIFETLVNETRARAARRVEIIHLGLTPWEAREMGLDSEAIGKPKKNTRRPVAQFVRDHDERNGTRWEAWLQENRYELNAMGLDVFIDWLERKLIENGVRKVVPPDGVIANEMSNRLAAAVRKEVTDRILREAGIDLLVSERLSSIGDNTPSASELREWLSSNTSEQWREFIECRVRSALEGG